MLQVGTPRFYNIFVYHTALIQTFNTSRLQQNNLSIRNPHTQIQRVRSKKVLRIKKKKKNFLEPGACSDKQFYENCRACNLFCYVT